MQTTVSDGRYGSELIHVTGSSSRERHMRGGALPSFRLPTGTHRERVVPMRRTNRQPRRRHTDRPGHRTLRAILWWCALFGVWLVLVDSLAHPEVAAGPVAALLALLVVLGVSAHARRHYRARLRWIGVLGHLPAGIVRDSALLGRVLFRHVVLRRPPSGAFRLVPFPAGARDDPESIAWQALATIATSLTPNTYIVGIDDQRGVALVHQLVPSSAERLRRTVIGAEPLKRGE